MKIERTTSYYTQAQLRAYLIRMGFPGFRESSPLPQPNLATLHAVVLHHLLTFPFENVEMHYSKHHLVSITPGDIYARLVESKKGGGYCFVQNSLLLGMLRALDYPTYAVGARVNSQQSSDLPPLYGDLNHAVLFVKPEDAPVHLADVGFGGQGLITPIQLRDDVIVQGACGEEHQLVRGLPPGAVRTDDPGWILECRYGAQGPWRAVYQFSEVEVFPSDYEARSFAICARPTPAPFWTDVLCILHEQIDGGEVGRLMMAQGSVRRRVGPEAIVLENCRTETERASALKKYFGIEISEGEMLCIEGRAAALPVR